MINNGSLSEAWAPFVSKLRTSIQSQCFTRIGKHKRVGRSDFKTATVLYRDVVRWDSSAVTSKEARRWNVHGRLWCAATCRRRVLAQNDRRRNLAASRNRGSGHCATLARATCESDRQLLQQLQHTTHTDHARVSRDERPTGHIIAGHFGDKTLQIALALTTRNKETQHYIHQKHKETIWNNLSLANT